MDTLSENSTLHQGNALRSTNDAFRAIMQDDGNFVVYRDHRPVWASGTDGKGEPSYHLTMQEDGNLVVYDSTGAPLWASNTMHKGTRPHRLVMQNDQNLVLYDAHDNPTWATGTNIPVQSGDQHPSNFVTECLAAHNKMRAAVGVPPLQWSDNLASSAHPVAARCASLGRLEHSGRGGENLHWGTQGEHVQHMVESWGSEIRFFVNGRFPNIATHGRTWHDVGHYSQCVWRHTTHVGGAVVVNNGRVYLCCHYEPKGNFQGEQVY